ncbi:uncharacterized protein FTOL_12304 [Fusarium torulosum]|uniref:WSC domain-containing protein n=1 Tax=Fusarium torulosum TaxID=33205 RepID=A0AAE8MLL0_9HYPO|nr:uncharacterized protein FTOL_12304 [Fusarium torulosum]
MARLDLLLVSLFLWVVPTAAQVPVIAQLTPEGCYRGQPRFALHAGYTGTQAERERCIESCHRNESPIVVFGENSCWCANEDAYSRADSVDETRCVQCLIKKDPECARHERDLHQIIKLTTDEEPKEHPPKVGQITAQGCYHTRVRRSMTRGMMQDDKSLLACAKSCAENGMPLATVSGRVCYCTRSYPSDKYKVASKQCYMPCSSEGDNDRCRIGHAYNPRRSLRYLTVYDTGLGVDVATDSGSDRVSRPTSGEKTTEFEPKSLSRQVARCYTDGPVDAVSVPLDSAEMNNFHESCLLACRRSERAIAIMQDTLCACAPAYPRTLSATTARNCHIPCRGDGSYSCGGVQDDRGTAFSVYRTGFTPAPKPRIGAHGFQGCFNVQPATVVLKEFRRMNSVFTCTRYCKREDRAVAAIKAGWCLCADTYPSEDAKVSDSKCSTICPGWADQVCGGRGVWSVHNTGTNLNVGSDVPRTEKGNNPSNSPTARPQCTIPGLESIYEAFSWVVTKVEGFAHNLSEAIGGFIDGAQDIFDACLWRVMVFVSDAIYSGEGDVGL